MTTFKRQILLDQEFHEGIFLLYNQDMIFIAQSQWSQTRDIEKSIFLLAYSISPSFFFFFFDLNV